MMNYSDGKWIYKEKYSSPVKKLLMDLIELITPENSHLSTVPEYLQVNVAIACPSLLRDSTLLKISELEEVFLSAQNLGITVLHDLKKEVPIDKKVISRFRMLIKLSGLLSMKWRSLYRHDTPEEDLIGKIYESKLIEEFITAYEEIPSLHQKAGDVNVTEAVWEFMEFITNFLSYNSSFLTKERNLNFLKLVFQDACEVDTKPVSKQPFESLSCSITYSFCQTEFVDYMKTLKDEKLLFGLLRTYLLGPYIYNWESNDFLEKFCRAFSQDLAQERVFFHLFGKFLEVFETKMRNPSLDFEDALKQFENGIENEKKNYQQAIEGVTSLSYPADKEVFIIDDRTSIESLRLFVGGYCRRISVVIEKISLVFRSNLENLNES